MTQQLETTPTFSPSAPHATRPWASKRWAGWTACMSFGLLAACGGGSSGGGSVASTPTPVASTTPTTTVTTTPTTTPTTTATTTPVAASTFQTAEYNRSTGPSQHGAITGWAAGASGQGVTLAIVDSGIDNTNPEFAGRISSASIDVAGTRGIFNAPDDHGTSVALTAAAARNNVGIMGVAYNATILALRADTPGSCASSGGCKFDDNNIAAGVDRAVANGAKVINLSLGGSSPASILVNAIGRAANAGVVVVVSSGNDGATNPDLFASGLRQAGNGNVIIAGSVDKTNVISSFTNQAGTEQQWFLNALGEQVCCVYENGVIKTTATNGQNFVTVSSGTSFSAPQIAGAAALLIQAFPNLTAAQVVNLLLKTAKDGGATGTDAVYGRGILDIAAAFVPQGTTSLAGTTAMLAMSDTAAVTSPAMGDATQKAALSTLVLDSYNRAYQVNLAASLNGAQIAPKLTSALTSQMRQLATGNEHLALAFTVDNSGHVASMAWSRQLSLSHQDATKAKVLAARIVARISPKSQMGFAFSGGADGLVAQMQGQNQPAFLIAGNPLQDTGFARSGQTSFALRRDMGGAMKGWGMTISAERGEAISAAPLRIGGSAISQRSTDMTSRFGVAFDREFGAFHSNFAASWMSEDRTILGARFANALGTRGATTLFLDVGLGWNASENLRIGAAWRQGFTHIRKGGQVLSGSNLASNAWAIDATRQNALKQGDSLAFRLSQPLRVASGGIGFNLPTSYNYATLSPIYGISTLNLAPKGREMTGELAWHAPMLGGAGGASIYYRHNPGNYSQVAADKGLAFSWNGKF